MWKGLQHDLKLLSKGEEERLRRVFDRIDKDADGVISASGTLSTHL
jgi:Ca2+-binding EF-hand superfamily protein